MKTARFRPDLSMGGAGCWRGGCICVTEGGGSPPPPHGIALLSARKPRLLELKARAHAAGTDAARKTMIRTIPKT